MSYIFNPHRNVTADGVLITEGLRVWTNEMQAGTVVSDDTSGEHMCCSDNKGFPEAVHHPKGQVRVNGGWFTDHSVTCDEGMYCRHNHWFRVSTAEGTKSFDGERMATQFEGRRP